MTDRDATATLPPHPVLPRYYADEAERRRRVASWFDQAAADYDWINSTLSLGRGEGYRREALVRAGLAAGMSLLDVGCGTGVVAAQGQSVVGASGRVAALDPSIGMLRQAARRPVRWRVRGMGETLPFPDGRFDMLSMGYALRHVDDLRRTFAEYRRVLTPGGTLLLLEITPPRGRVARGLLALYLGRLVPLLARFGRGGRASHEVMRYYWDTIVACVPPATILAALADVGFEAPRRHVEMGIFSEYTARRR